MDNYKSINYKKPFLVMFDDFTIEAPSFKTDDSPRSVSETWAAVRPPVNDVVCRSPSIINDSFHISFGALGHIKNSPSKRLSPPKYVNTNVQSKLNIGNSMRDHYYNSSSLVDTQKISFQNEHLNSDKLNVYNVNSPNPNIQMPNSVSGIPPSNYNSSELNQSKNPHGHFNQMSNEPLNFLSNFPRLGSRFPPRSTKLVPSSPSITNGDNTPTYYNNNSIPNRQSINYLPINCSYIDHHPHFHQTSESQEQFYQPPPRIVALSQPNTKSIAGTQLRPSSRSSISNGSGLQCDAAHAPIKVFHIATPNENLALNFNEQNSNPLTLPLPISKTIQRISSVPNSTNFLQNNIFISNGFDLNESINHQRKEVNEQNEYSNYVNDNLYDYEVNGVRSPLMLRPDNIIPHDSLNDIQSTHVNSLAATTNIPSPHLHSREASPYPISEYDLKTSKISALEFNLDPKSKTDFNKTVAIANLNTAESKGSSSSNFTFHNNASFISSNLTSILSSSTIEAKLRLSSSSFNANEDEGNAMLLLEMLQNAPIGYDSDGDSGGDIYDEEDDESCQEGELDETQLAQPSPLSPSATSVPSFLSHRTHSEKLINDSRRAEVMTSTPCDRDGSERELLESSLMAYFTGGQSQNGHSASKSASSCAMHDLNEMTRGKEDNILVDSESRKSLWRVDRNDGDLSLVLARGDMDKNNDGTANSENCIEFSSLQYPDFNPNKSCFRVQSASSCLTSVDQLTYVAQSCQQCVPIESASSASSEEMVLLSLSVSASSQNSSNETTEPQTQLLPSCSVIAPNDCPSSSKSIRNSTLELVHKKTSSQAAVSSQAFSGDSASECLEKEPYQKYYPSSLHHAHDNAHLPLEPFTLIDHAATSNKQAYSSPDPCRASFANDLSDQTVRRHGRADEADEGATIITADVLSTIAGNYPIATNTSLTPRTDREDPFTPHVAFPVSHAASSMSPKHAVNKGPHLSVVEVSSAIPTRCVRGSVGNRICENDMIDMKEKSSFKPHSARGANHSIRPTGDEDQMSLHEAATSDSCGQDTLNKVSCTSLMSKNDYPIPFILIPSPNSSSTIERHASVNKWDQNNNSTVLCTSNFVQSNTELDLTCSPVRLSSRTRLLHLQQQQQSLSNPVANNFPLYTPQNASSDSRSVEDYIKLSQTTPLRHFHPNPPSTLSFGIQLPPDTITNSFNRNEIRLPLTRDGVEIDYENKQFDDVDFIDKYDEDEDEEQIKSTQRKVYEKAMSEHLFLQQNRSNSPIMMTRNILSTPFSNRSPILVMNTSNSIKHKNGNLNTPFEVSSVKRPKSASCIQSSPHQTILKNVKFSSSFKTPKNQSSSVAKTKSTPVRRTPSSPLSTSRFLSSNKPAINSSSSPRSYLKPKSHSVPSNRVISDKNDRNKTPQSGWNNKNKALPSPTTTKRLKNRTPPSKKIKPAQTQNKPIKSTNQSNLGVSPISILAFNNSKDSKTSSGSSGLVLKSQFRPKPAVSSTSPSIITKKSSNYDHKNMPILIVQGKHDHANNSFEKRTSRSTANHRHNANRRKNSISPQPSSTAPHSMVRAAPHAPQKTKREKKDPFIWSPPPPQPSRVPKRSLSVRVDSRPAAPLPEANIMQQVKFEVKHDTPSSSHQRQAIAERIKKDFIDPATLSPLLVKQSVSSNFDALQIASNSPVNQTIPLSVSPSHPRDAVAQLPCSPFPLLVHHTFAALPGDACLISTLLPPSLCVSDAHDTEAEAPPNLQFPHAAYTVSQTESLSPRQSTPSSRITGVCEVSAVCDDQKANVSGNLHQEIESPPSSVFLPPQMAPIANYERHLEEPSPSERDISFHLTSFASQEKVFIALGSTSSNTNSSAHINQDSITFQNDISNPLPSEDHYVEEKDASNAYLEESIISASSTKTLLQPPHCMQQQVINGEFQSAKSSPRTIPIISNSPIPQQSMSYRRYNSFQPRLNRVETTTSSISHASISSARWRNQSVTRNKKIKSSTPTSNSQTETKSSPIKHWTSKRNETNHRQQLLQPLKIQSSIKIPSFLDAAASTSNNMHLLSNLSLLDESLGPLPHPEESLQLKRLKLSTHHLSSMNSISSCSKKINNPQKNLANSFNKLTVRPFEKTIIKIQQPLYQNYRQSPTKSHQTLFNNQNELKKKTLLVSSPVRPLQNYFKLNSNSQFVQTSPCMSLSKDYSTKSPTSLERNHRNNQYQSPVLKQRANALAVNRSDYLSPSLNNRVEKVFYDEELSSPQLKTWSPNNVYWKV